ncbi:MAG: hypothetical protein KGL04_10330 [Elusimicrobia bacterium]|nr:hypothetical protein [Elusimicrobiota bacterium]
MRVLVTAGATREYVDGVRFLTNVSTGKTGADLCAAFARLSHKVFLLRGQGAVSPARTGPASGSPPAVEDAFSDFADLDRKLKNLLRARDFDLVVHCAAVGDYSIESVAGGRRRFKPGRAGKIESSGPLVLRLTPNFKILDRLPGYAGPQALIVGFKLTNTPDLAKRLRAVKKLGAPVVVHNDLREMEAGRRVFRVYEDGRIVKISRSAPSLARALAQLGERHAARLGHR